MMRSLVVVCCLGLALQAGAQDKKSMSPEARAKFHAEKMQKELLLTAEQAKKIEAINLAHQQKMAPYKEQQKNLRKEMKKLHKDKEAELKSVLTAEQYQQHLAKKAERKKKMAERKKQHQQSKEKK